MAKIEIAGLPNNVDDLLALQSSLATTPEGVPQC